MNYKEKNIVSTSETIKSDEIVFQARKKDTDFTRNRKITVKDIIYYDLNKKGLSSKMELDRFIDICEIGDVSSPAMLKQRQKLNPEVFRYLKNQSLKLFYTEFKEEVKTYKGWLLYAADGSDFEIPNTKKCKKEYNSPIKGKSNEPMCARANIGNMYDLLNNYVVDTVIKPYQSDEIKMMQENLRVAKELVDDYKIIRIMDRGYVSLEDIYLSQLNNDKYIVRLKKKDFGIERKNMKTNDETINIGYVKTRMYYYENKNPELIEYLKSGNLLKTRVVNIAIPTGEIETLITNLSEDEMTYEELNELYRLRWGIETSYHYLKESMKIETITSSNEDIIKQDILSQMFVFNILQSFQNDAEQEINQEDYKHKMKININMATGYIKQYLIYILMEDDGEIRDSYMSILNEKILKHIVPIRPNRNYERKKDVKNKHHINKRKTF